MLTGDGSDVVHVERAIRELAGRQHGVVTRAQISGLGLGRSGIAHRLRTGHFTAMHRGIYAVGHTALSDLARVQAALLITPDSGASQRGRRGDSRSHPLNARRYRRHGPRPSTEKPRNRPLPRTTARGMDDSAGPQGDDAASDPRGPRLPRPGHRRGAREAPCPPHEIDRPPTRSHLEREFLRLITQAGLPQPLVNHRFGPYLLDFYWPEQRLIVETDGATHHHNRARRRDRQRDEALRRDGMKVVRFDTDEVTHRPLRLVASLTNELRT